MIRMIDAKDVTPGMIVYYSTHSAPVTVSSVEHDVPRYAKRVTVVSGEDTNGVPITLDCHPEFVFMIHA